ncbi:hypothetical protein KY330_05565 [Candidatus Woesearchaeota archaeon]|nr:hypothetical protein [Candidatus Woesearchaeota archaeon]
MENKKLYDTILKSRFKPGVPNYYAVGCDGKGVYLKSIVIDDISKYCNLKPIVGDSPDDATWVEQEDGLLRKVKQLSKNEEAFDFTGCVVFYNKD